LDEESAARRAAGTACETGARTVILGSAELALRQGTRDALCSTITHPQPRRKEHDMATEQQPRPQSRQSPEEKKDRRPGNTQPDGVVEQSDPDKEPLTPSGDQRIAVEE
jgi:hypothetical protein